ncbi:Uma2 family endonuclease [Streptomyces kunmingensis]|uniref:Uma2 family endonuclease n=1 Tax=Streptomyces kunmingensis TaxID=68225 RepID=A0ABU6CDD8_9ACTN|nr:Uma2 family endonuclease [Streptomyces kunmingensis]MEB3962196.1 Uma2 family endonuclease [Streptomyces kunmingensis]
MTVMAERTTSETSPMSVDEFEKIAAVSAKETEAVRLEFINGRIGIKGVTDGNHSALIMWLIRQCMQERPELDLTPTLGLKVEAYRKGRAEPDGVLAPVDHFVGQGNWADAEGVLMTVEITSYDSDTHARDRVEKPGAYAEAGIPVYLLVDRDAGTVVVHSNPDPEHSHYRDTHTALFGERVPLPDPVGIELDTEQLKRYVR